MGMGGSRRWRLLICHLCMLPFCLVTCERLQKPAEDEDEETTTCSIDSTKRSSCTRLTMAHSAPPNKSLALVRELLHPFSLHDFTNEYWEKKPLLIRGRSSDHYKRLVRFGIADVETVIENGQSLFDEEGQRQEKRHDEHHHEPGPMILGTDWNIIKRIFVPADGEFWTAALPPSKVERSGGGGNKVISLEETRAAFQRGGFSIVINRLQRRWRSVSEISLALEDALGHPVNANLYMTPPGSQGFEAHFDWMDGLVVQLVGSKRWILYDEMVPVPTADLKYKPAAADLGEPIGVVQLNPGDLMYIPRGWPHEAAVNVTGEGARTSARTSGPALHITFGIESSTYGSYEALLHHALEVAQVEHPNFHHGEDGLPWLELLHIWVHDIASRNEYFRRSVPLAQMLHSRSASSSTLDRVNAGNDACPEDTAQSDGPVDEVAPDISRGFQRVLHVCEESTADEHVSSTVDLVDSMLRGEGGGLERIRTMFVVHVGADDERGGSRESEGAYEGAQGENRDGADAVLFESEGEWNRSSLQAFNRARFSSSSLRKRVEAFAEIVSLEDTVQRMVLATSTRARQRKTSTERDLQRCGQHNT